jgi:U3 small nucleolar RNA-associated protein 13
MVVTGSKDNTVRVWRVEPDGAGLVCCGVGRGHTMSVTAVSCSKSGNHFIVSGSEDQTIKLWSLDISSQSKWTLNTSFTAVAHKKDINSLDVSPNDKLIVSGSHDKTAKIWSVRDGALIGTLKGHKRGVWSVQFSPVDQCVLTSSTDSTIKLWSVSSCSCLKTFEGHTQSVLKAVFISRGLQIASVDNNGIMKIWNIKDNDCVCTVDGHTDRVWALTSSDDGSFLLTGGNDSTLHIWKDVTIEVLEREREEKILLVENEQKLMNLLQVEDYTTAVGVAIDLAQPTRLYDILTKIIDENGFDGDFADTITSLNEAQMKTLLDYVIQWNSNSKHCMIAQAVLNVILRVAPACIARVPELMAYTEKHFQRLSKIYMLSTFLDIVR